MLKKEIYDFLFENKQFEGKTKEEINLAFKELLRLDFPTYLLTNNKEKIKELLDCNSLPDLNFEERFNALKKITSNYINGSKIEDFTPFLFLINKGSDFKNELDTFLLKVKDLKILFYSNNIFNKSNPGKGKFLLPENKNLSDMLFTSYSFTKEMPIKYRSMFSFSNAADSQYLKTLYLLLNEDLTLNQEKISILKYFLNENDFKHYLNLINHLDIVNYENYLSKNQLNNELNISKIITLPFKDTYLHINILHSTRAIFALNDSIINLLIERKNNSTMELNYFKFNKNLQMISKPQNLFFPAPQGNVGFFILKNSEIYFDKKHIKNICLEESSMEELKKLFFKIKNNMFYLNHDKKQKINSIKALIQDFRINDKLDNFQYKKHIVESNLNILIKYFLKYVFIFDQEAEDFVEKYELFTKRLNKIIKEEFNINNNELIKNLDNLIRGALNEKFHNN